MSDIAPTALLDLLNGYGLGVEYQPIIRLSDGQCIAFEALARFRGRDGQLLRPDHVFRALHASPLSLFQLEFRLKQLQIKYAPEGSRLFLNIDQDAFDVFGLEQMHPMVELLSQRNDCVVEIIENSSVSDAHVSIAMQQAFGAAGIPLALDDVGSLDSLISFDVLADVDYLKLAGDWLVRLSRPAARHLLDGLLHFARDTGKTVILEGIETPQQLAWAQELGVDAVQGYLFQERFVCCWHSAPCSAPVGYESVLIAEPGLDLV